MLGFTPLSAAGLSDILLTVVEPIAGVIAGTSAATGALNDAVSLRNTPADIRADTFTDTNGTALTAHTPDSGGAWLTASSGAGAWDIQSNQANLATSSGGRDVAYFDAGTADARVTVKATPAAAFYNQGAVLRFTAQDAHWKAVCYATSNLFAIVEVTAGSETIRASTTVTVTAGVQYTIAFSARGDNFTATLDGANTLAYTSSVRNTATKHGFGGGPAALTKFDDFGIQPSTAVIAGAETVTADLTVAGSGSAIALAGSAAGVETVSATLDSGNGLTGQAASAETATGNLPVAIALAGAAAGTATVNGALNAGPALAGGAAGIESVGGALAIGIGLQGQAGGVEAVSGDLTVTAGGATIPLAGDAAGLSAVTAELSVSGGAAQQVYGTGRRDIAGFGAGMSATPYAQVRKGVWVLGDAARAVIEAEAIINREEEELILLELA